MKKLIIFLFILLSFTNFSFFRIGAANFTLFHAMVLLLLILMAFMAVKNKRAVVKAPLLFLLASAYLCYINLKYFGYIKVSSFVYSIIILGELLFIYNLVKRLEIEDIRKIAKIIILVYFINILIAYLFIQFHYFPQGILSNIFRIYIFDGRIRPYGFSDEPSYASLILIFTLFLLFKCDNFSYKSGELKWYAIAIITIMLTGSSYGYMLLAILLFYFILKSGLFIVQLYQIAKSKVFSKGEFFAGFGLLIIACAFAFQSVDVTKNKSVDRLVSIFNSFTSPPENESGDAIKTIERIDGSASMRVLPTIHLITNFKKEQLRFILFGRGAGMSVFFFSLLYDGNTTILGFIPSFVYNYGIVGFLLFMTLFISFFPKKKTVLFILFFLFIFNADFNTQIFLFVLFTIMSARQIERKKLIQPPIVYAEN